jgi:hypothetical protein
MRFDYSCLLAISLLGACADQSYPGDDAADVEISTDGKTDGWLTDTPQGTFSTTNAATGEVAKLTLNADMTFEREIEDAGANTVTTGKYKFTQGGGNRYIRFLKPNGTLIERYGFEMHGRQLSVRKVGASEWQPLMAEDNFGAVQSAYAGTYTAYGRGTLPEGSIFELMLHDTGRFHITIQKTYACSAPGHSCGSSWSDGWTGWSYVAGTWEERTGGVTLTPRNEVTGAEGWKINLDMTISGAGVTISGKDGNVDLVGDMDVEALFTGAHSVENDEISGSWSVANVGTDPDYTVSLWGTALVVNGSTHAMTFDAETNEICELSPNVNNEPQCGIYQIAKDPSGGARGVVYGYRGHEFTALKITNLTTNTLRLTNGETSFVLTRQ